MVFFIDFVSSLQICKSEELKNGERGRFIFCDMSIVIKYRRYFYRVGPSLVTCLCIFVLRHKRGSFPAVLPPGGLEEGLRKWYVSAPGRLAI